MQVRFDAAAVAGDATQLAAAVSKVQSSTSTLASQLGSCSGMAGIDPMAEDFANGSEHDGGYDLSMNSMLRSGTTLAQAIAGFEGQILGLAAGYRAMELAGAPAGSSNIYTTMTPSKPSASAPTVGSALGDEQRGTPQGEIMEWLEDFLKNTAGIVIPTADTGKVRNASAAWGSFANDLSAGKATVSAALPATLAATFPQRDAVAASQNKIAELFDALVTDARALESGCSAYASNVDEIRGELLAMLGQLALEIAIDIGVGVALSFFTFGAGALAGLAKAATTVARWIPKLLAVVNRLRALIQSSRRLMAVMRRAAIEAIEATVSGTVANAGASLAFGKFEWNQLGGAAIASGAGGMFSGPFSSIGTNIASRGPRLTVTGGVGALTGGAGGIAGDWAASQITGQEFNLVMSALGGTAGGGLGGGLGSIKTPGSVPSGGTPGGISSGSGSSGSGNTQIPNAAPGGGAGSTGGAATSGGTGSSSVPTNAAPTGNPGGGGASSNAGSAGAPGIPSGGAPSGGAPSGGSGGSAGGGSAGTGATSVPVGGDGGGSSSSSGEGSGSRPADGSGSRPADGSGARPGDGSGARPGDGDGSRPADGSGARPAESSGVSAAQPRSDNTAQSPTQEEISAHDVTDGESADHVSEGGSSNSGGESVPDGDPGQAESTNNPDDNRSGEAAQIGSQEAPSNYDPAVQAQLSPEAQEIIAGTSPSGPGWHRVIDFGVREPDYGSPRPHPGTIDDNYVPTLDSSGHIVDLGSAARLLDADPKMPFGHDGFAGPAHDRDSWELTNVDVDSSKPGGPGNLHWSPNQGAVAGTRVQFTNLDEFRRVFGALGIDRLGGKSGSYMGIGGGSFNDRALPPNQLEQDMYSDINLKKDATLPEGWSLEISMVGEAYGQDGGALQLVLRNHDGEDVRLNRKEFMLMFDSTLRDIS